MTHKEMTEKSKNTILLGGLKLYGTRGFADTSFSDLEEETGLTRGAFFHHYGRSINVFEATVNKYYFNRVTACSVPEEYRSSLKGFYTKLVEMLEEEWLTMVKLGIKELGKTYFFLEYDAMIYLPDFKERCSEATEKELEVWLQVITNAIRLQEIDTGESPLSIVGLFVSTIKGHAIESSIEGKLCYTDGLMRQLNNLYSLLQPVKEPILTK